MIYPKVVVLVFLASALLAPFSKGEESREKRQQYQEQFAAAQKAAKSGEIGKALGGFLSVPGGEVYALGLLNKHPEEAEAALKQILSDQTNSPSKIRALLLLAETKMAKSDPLFALKSLRKFVSHIAEPGSDRGWDESVVPYNYYPVETSDAPGFLSFHRHSLSPRINPFQSGPGSYTNNWLLRRFIALEEWDDATREFRRIAALHVENIEEAGSPDSSALEFAIEFAFYLNKQDKKDEAESYLIKTFLALNIEWSRESPGFDSYSQRPSGISVDEFIRLGYGALKDAGREDELITVLQNSGNPASLQVLAKIEVHRNKPEKALALELQFLEDKRFSPVSKEIRKGKIYASFDRHKEAASHFEKALSLPKEKHPDLPSAPFDPNYSGMEDRVPFLGDLPLNISAIVRKPKKRDLPPINYRPDVLDELKKSYQALGQSDKVVSTQLRIWDEEPNWLNHFERVDNLAQLAASSIQFHEFKAWAKKKMPTLPPEAQANLSWALGDYEATVSALGKTTNIHYFDNWLTRLQDVEDGKYIVPLLTTMTNANPGESRYVLLLRKYSAGESRDEELVTLYENEFLPEARPNFQRGKGVYDEAVYADFYDLADRLMRLYHKLGQQEKLEELGLRMARSEKPFTENQKSSQLHNASNDEPAMSFLITHAGEETLQKLNSILTEEQWPSGRIHLDWVLAGGVENDIATFKASEAPPSNLPENVSVLVSYENVQDLAHNGENLFVGFPWGVGIYDFEGNLLRRIFLEEAALRIAADKKNLWIGTAVGLRHVDLETQQISQLRMDHERNPEDRSNKDYDVDFYNGVTGLAIVGDTLWIGTRQNIRKLNTKTLDLRIFSKEELNVGNHSDWKWFLVQEDGKIWANSRDESRRYDPERDLWETPGSSSVPNSVQLMGELDGQIWASVFISKELGWRPGILNPESLEVSDPIGMSPATRDSTNGLLHELSLFGKFDGRIGFGNSGPRFFLNQETGLIETIEDSWQLQMEVAGLKLPQEFSANEKFFRHDGSVARTYQVALPLPNGDVVIGKRHSESPRYMYPNEDWPFRAVQKDEMRENYGGLHLVKKDQPVSRLSREGLAGDMVFDGAPWKGQFWLTTHAGISLATASGHVTTNYNRQHGLPGNCAFDVEELGGNFYFASRFDDHDGGLISFDPKRSNFQTINAADGLSGNAIKSLVVKNEQLEVHFAPEYRRTGEGRYHLFPRTTIDPLNHEFPSRVKPEILTGDPHRFTKRPHGKSMPFLGGSIISEYTFGQKKWLLGTRGVVILPASETAVPLTGTFPELEAKVVTDPRVQLLAEARKLRYDKSLSPEDKIKHPNPLVVADALARWKTPLSAKDFPFVVETLNSPSSKLRYTAAYLLFRTDTPESAETLRTLLDDPGSSIRALAVLAITKHGDDLPIKGLEEILQPRSEKAVKAISERGNRMDQSAIELVLRYPFDFRPHQNPAPALEKLGAAVSSQPELARVLLTAKDTRKNQHTDREMARDIFQFTGPAVLPILHEALKSDDRIVRANAALGCGAVGDKSSIQPLIAALDLESGLSKGAIVRALGELQARETLPLLENLYREAQAAENLRYQSGMQFSQIGVQKQETLRRIESLRLDWNEIENSKANAAAPADPNTEEPLLSKRIILTAVEKIGPEHAQPFYRYIAAKSSGHEGRSAAATHLAAADASERAASMEALRIISADNDNFARMALVSLFLLGDETAAQHGILRYLKKEHPGGMVNELAERVKNRKSLNFAKEALTSIRDDKEQHGSTRKTAGGLLKGL